MNTRILRPALSPRYRLLHTTKKRCLASQTAQTTELPPPRSFYQFSRGTWIYLAVVFTTGAAAGTLLRRNVIKPRYPEPDTPEDKLLIAQLNERIDKEFKVNVLRGKCLGVAKQLKGEEGGWVELVQQEEKQSAESLDRSLAGARGLGVERLFWNRADETLVAIIYFGPSMSGWPNVTHGGVIATQFLNKIGLAMALARGAGDQVSRSAVPQRLPGTGDHAKMLLSADIQEEPREMSLSYVKPTLTENFYVLRVSPTLPLGVDPPHVIPPEPQSGTHDWEATLEAMDARILVKAKATYKPFSVKDRIERGIDTTTQWTYDHFRQWMWPSRQGSLHS